MRSIGNSNDHHGDRLFLTDVEKDMDSQMIDDLKHRDISPDEEKGSARLATVTTAGLTSKARVVEKAKENQKEQDDGHMDRCTRTSLPAVLLMTTTKMKLLGM